MNTKQIREFSLKKKYKAYVETCIHTGEYIRTFVEFCEMMDAIEKGGQEDDAEKTINKIIREKATPLMLEVASDVMAERIRQNGKWGKQRHDAGKWLAILVEEVGEAAQAAMPSLGLTTTKETDADDLYEELAHVSAVAKAWMEQIREEREQKE
jgi:NTP pyrophosphatase (non-canonical NTP hydrolase)